MRLAQTATLSILSAAMPAPLLSTAMRLLSCVDAPPPADAASPQMAAQPQHAAPDAFPGAGPASPAAPHFRPGRSGMAASTFDASDSEPPPRSNLENGGLMHLKGQTVVSMECGQQRRFELVRGPP